MSEFKPLEPASDVGDLVLATERVREQMRDLHARLPRERLPMWVVFGPRTADHPGLFVARLWMTLPEAGPTRVLLRAGSLDQLRDLLPAGLSRLNRQPEDDPNIIETWI